MIAAPTLAFSIQETPVTVIAAPTLAFSIQVTPMTVIAAPTLAVSIQVTPLISGRTFVTSPPLAAAKDQVRNAASTSAT